MKWYIVPLIRPATRLKMTGSGAKIFFILSGSPMEMEIRKRSRLRTRRTRVFAVLRPPPCKRLIQTGLLEAWDFVRRLR